MGLTIEQVSKLYSMYINSSNGYKGVFYAGHSSDTSYAGNNIKVFLTPTSGHETGYFIISQNVYSMTVTFYYFE